MGLYTHKMLPHHNTLLAMARDLPTLAKGYGHPSQAVAIYRLTSRIISPDPPYQQSLETAGVVRSYSATNSKPYKLKMGIILAQK